METNSINTKTKQKSLSNDYIERDKEKKVYYKFTITVLKQISNTLLNKKNKNKKKT